MINNLPDLIRYCFFIPTLSAIKIIIIAFDFDQTQFLEEILETYSIVESFDNRRPMVFFVIFVKIRHWSFFGRVLILVCLIDHCQVSIIKIAKFSRANYFSKYRVPKFIQIIKFTGMHYMCFNLALLNLANGKTV